MEARAQIASDSNRSLARVESKISRAGGAIRSTSKSSSMIKKISRSLGAGFVVTEPNMSENLWPDFEAANAPRSPKTVIKEGGAGLEKKTNGLVNFYPMNITIKDNNVELTFSFYDPSLIYHFPFLRAKFAVEPPYPVTVVADKMPDVVANDENQLTAALTRIFNAPSTVETIQRLISLSQQ